MPHNLLLIPPSSAFWPQFVQTLAAQHLLEVQQHDFSGLRIVVPNFAHAQALKTALADYIGHPFIPPRITTLSSWLALLPPAAEVASHGERLMSLYAELRKHGWLKKLFSAKRNTDLLPLADVLVSLFDELSVALLPAMDSAEQRWQAALEQLPLPARQIVSDEAQLVWSLWKSQLDRSDPTAARFAQMMRLAQLADAPLVWVGEADPLQQAFLQAYVRRQTVWQIALDWRREAVSGALARAWPEMLEQDGGSAISAAGQPAVTTPAGLSLHAAGSLEAQAQQGAQTVIDWLAAGKSSVAIIAQDRVTARRIRALLERAQIEVCDETGWKLSTTRAAAAIAALLEAVATHGETVVLLDLLKSPFCFAHVEGKPHLVMTIEHALRRMNVPGGWEAAIHAVEDAGAKALLEQLAGHASRFSGSKRLADWGELTAEVMQEIGMRDALAADAAGAQVVALLDLLSHDCAAMAHPFSFAEWRAFLSLQIESTPFVPQVSDRRVVMLQLVGARMRRFDAVLMVGADADHLPSQTGETLFFANAVRRELGLATREEQQRTQLRDFAELLTANPQVVLSYQSSRNGEPNPVSNWIERLQLVLERHGAAGIPEHRVDIPVHELVQQLPVMPRPCAPQLLPRRLSASAYNSLAACPYQFFASRMLGISGLDELSDMPEKRDYGAWLHEILMAYHQTVRERRTPFEQREALLRSVSERVFARELERSAAALGYYVRWQKVIPAYIAWANERERQGWRFVAGEQKLERVLHWPDGRIVLHGVIDRIDENEAGERAVLDYKTKDVSSLRKRLKGMEDHQLAYYGVLTGMQATAAGFVALELYKDQTGDAAADNFTEWQQKLEEQIIDNVRAIAQGASLPATGISGVCKYCEVRGLCRKGAW